MTRNHDTLAPTNHFWRAAAVLALAAGAACGAGEDVSLGSNSDELRKNARGPKANTDGGTAIDNLTPWFAALSDVPYPSSGTIHVQGIAADDVAIGRIEVSVVPTGTDAQGLPGRCDFSRRVYIFHACPADWSCPQTLVPASSVPFDVAIDTTTFANAEYCIYVAINDTTGKGHSMTWSGVKFENVQARDTETPSFQTLADLTYPTTGTVHVKGIAIDNVAIGRIEVSVVPTYTDELGISGHCDFNSRTYIHHACASMWTCPQTLEPAPSVAFDVPIDSAAFPNGEYCVYIAINDTTGNGHSFTWSGIQFEN